MVADPAELILLFEDKPDDVFALQRALRKAGVTNPVHVATDGQQALDFLAPPTNPAGAARPFPFLVLLDLKLPYRDGFEVLQWIRQQSHLGNVSVVMLTGSDESRDHQRAYALGARSYLVKPASAEDIQSIIDSLKTRPPKATIA